MTIPYPESDPFPTDPALWKPISPDLKRYWSTNGPKSCQNWECDHRASAREYNEKNKIKLRYFTKSLLGRVLPNGEIVSRDWHLYSPSTGKIFCFYGTLFDSNPNNCLFSEKGFDDWKHPEVVHQHEKCSGHFESIKVFKLWEMKNGLVDSQQLLLLQQEERYWEAVIVRVIEPVRYLAERGQAFRGDSHEIGNPHNGNYLGAMELIAKFDTFLADHITRYGNRGRGNTSYLSHTVMEEVISILASEVKANILSSILNLKYYSIIADSTPDISHIDQLTLVVRYIENAKPVERYVGFVPIKSHKSESLTERILSLVAALGLDINMCRGQSYDNASNMSGKYSGVQARISKINQCAPYVPCAAHSLNLVGTSAAESYTAAVLFFCIVAEIYRFFSASPCR